VRRLLASTSVFVLACQRDSEGGSDNLPTVIAEAMFAGVPCISTTMAGVPEMIDNGTDGLLVAPREPLQLAQTMQRLLVDHVLSLTIGAAGQATARAKFSIEKTVAEFWRLLRLKARVPDQNGSRRWLPW
jgi:glycosyltransferase involved in cell wall biosynthesis